MDATQTPNTPEQDIRLRIIHILSIYPYLSSSMLQLTLPYTAAEWRPVLDDLIADDVVVMDTKVAQTPTGRHQVHNLLKLSNSSNQVQVQVQVQVPESLDQSNATTSPAPLEWQPESESDWQPHLLPDTSKVTT